MNPKLIEAATDHGIVSWNRAEQAWRACDAAGIPFFVGCPFLMQESGGGDNVFGHDARNGEPIWHGRDDRVQVTQARYEAYKVYRDIGPERRMQGVGPMQLTWYSIQDTADELGGCWDPYSNMLTAFQVLANLRATYDSWHEAAGNYNGGPDWRDKPDAVKYAATVTGRIEDFRRWFQVGDR